MNSGLVEKDKRTFHWANEIDKIHGWQDSTFGGVWFFSRCPMLIVSHDVHVSSLLLKASNIRRIFATTLFYSL